MKLFDTDTETISLSSGHFNFSGVRPDSLGAVEYTLAVVVTDTSGSLTGHESALLRMRQEVVKSLKQNPRSDFVLLRTTEFSSDIREVHGFLEVPTLEEAKYQAPRCGGTTCLYDAALEAISSTVVYGKQLKDQDMAVNAIVYIITDGVDYGSKSTPSMVKAELQSVLASENLQSLEVILIGINANDPRISSELKRFQREGGLMQYFDAGNVTADNLAKLGQAVSASISQTSQSLSTGGGSKPISF